MRRVIPPDINRKLVVYTNRPSASGRTLARALSCRYVHSLRKRIVPISPTRGLVVNWGALSPLPEAIAQARRVLNPAERVHNAASKVVAYSVWNEAGIPTIDWTSEYDEAMAWSNDGVCVLSRRDFLSGGKGIYINPPNSTVRRSQFYARYYAKTHEYRIHVFNGRVIDFTQKRKRGDTDADEDTRTNRQRLIRTIDHGWVHCHDDIHLRDAVLDRVADDCCRAVAVLGLDFGAIDLMVTTSKKYPDKILSHRIAEVNTAPGLGNTATIAAYIQAIRETYQTIRGR